MKCFFLIKLFGIFEEFFTLSPLYTVGWLSKTDMFDLKLLAENDTKEKIKNLIETKIVRTIFFIMVCIRPRLSLCKGPKIIDLDIWYTYW